MKYVAEISYDGSQYFGWQIQPELPTIQQAVENVLTLINGSPVKAAGAGRTDAGVHARAQTCSFELSKEWELRKLALAMNANLPDGISVIRTARVSDNFHARFSAVAREYRYFIWNNPTISPLIKDKTHWIKKTDLDWKTAAIAAKQLIGVHDFKNFCCHPIEIQDTTREIKHIKLIKKGSLITLGIKADGFLHNMVRIITGCLIKIASNNTQNTGTRASESEKIRILWIKKLLDPSTQREAYTPAPPHGLYLWKTEYKDKIDWWPK